MYYYDSLGDERFQELCQALISSNFPNAQCLPVGQPDGGRDAFVLREALARRKSGKSEKDVIVFQVKYVRSAKDSREERDFISQIIKSERRNIDRLRSAGMTAYYLITNLKGTAHRASGSIDRVNSQLSAEVGCDAYCWWRDDLDRRLDGNSSIKWSYPEILKATDLLQKLVEGNLGEEERRRTDAIRAYMASQFDDDEELKFKQTDLRSTMTDLFVDLP